MFNFKYKSIDFAHKFDKTILPSEDFDRHLHYFNEIIFFVSGDVNYTVESNSRKLEPGDIVLITPGQYHYASVNPNVAYERYVLKFPNSILSSYLVSKLKKQASFFTNIKKYHFMLNNLDEYYENYEDDDFYILCICELTKLLVLLCKENSSSPIRQNETTYKIINFIDENIHKNITLDTLAKEFNFSKSYISSEFKKHIKTPIIQYIRAKKIIAAHEMILSGVKKTVVAELFGYENYSTFYREYMKIIGCSPNGKNKKNQHY